MNFSELMEKLDQAKSITKEAVQICQTMFFENKGEVENGDQWFENVSNIWLIFINNCYFYKKKLKKNA